MTMTLEIEIVPNRFRLPDNRNLRISDRTRNKSRKPKLRGPLGERTVLQCGANWSRTNDLILIRDAL